jgi:hypothetical protein
MGTIGLQKQLDELEKQFRVELLRGLSEASQNAASQFFRSEEHNSFEVLKGRTDPLTNDLLEQARAIVQLRKKLGEWPEKSVAAKFIDYCEKYKTYQIRTELAYESTRWHSWMRLAIEHSLLLGQVLREPAQDSAR